MNFFSDPNLPPGCKWLPGDRDEDDYCDKCGKQHDFCICLCPICGERHYDCTCKP